MSREFKIENLTNWEEQKESIISIIDDLLNLFMAKSSIIVVTRPTDEVGLYDHQEANIFSGMIEANDFINQLMYSKNTSAKIFSVENNQYVLLFDKCFDAYNYSRPAMCTVNNINDSKNEIARLIFDINTKVIIH